MTWIAANPVDFAIKDYKAVITKKTDSNVVRTISNINSTSTSVRGLVAFTTYIVEISARSSVNAFSDASTLEVTTDQGGMHNLYKLLIFCDPFSNCRMH